MSMIIWLDEEADKGIDLGNPFFVYAAFGKMAKVAGSGHGWQDLFSVPEFAEQEVEKSWMDAVSSQARQFHAKYSHSLDEQSRWILMQLANRVTT